MYKEDGYRDIWEFAFDTYGISRSTASRYIAINDRFSEHGNSPVLAAAYQDYSKSKLQEMLYLTDEQIENVTPEMTVKEIREGRETEQCIETEPAKCITGKSSSGFCGAAAYCDEPVQCCAACKKDCNCRCGWLEECATSHKNIVANETMCITAKEEVNSEYLEELSHEEIIPVAEIEGQVKISDYEGIVPEGMTIICKEREKEEITPQDVLKEETEKLNEWLSAFEGEELPSFVIRQKIIVEALNKTIITEPEQPEFQILKNNEQRKQWLNNYKEWGLWYEDSNTGASFYKYDFENGARLIAETYKYRNEYARTEYMGTEFEFCYFHLVGGPEPPRTKYGCGKWTRHETYNRNADNITELVEFLKAVQKGENYEG